MSTNIVSPIPQVGKAQPSTNGHGPDHDAEIERLFNVGQVPDEPEEQEQQTNLLDQLAELDLDTEALKAWALDHIDQLSQMSAADFGKFEIALRQKGAGAEWIRLVLKKAVNEDRKKSNAVSYLDYVKAAENLGYTFKLNELNDSLEVNGERMTDVLDAELLSRLHDEGFQNVEIARRAFLTKAQAHRYHPIKQYLEKLKWDGQDHIEKLCSHITDAHEPITYADGTQRSVFHALMRRWLSNAVGKVYDSSTYQNPMLIMAGNQGRGKSYFVKWLCPLLKLHMESAIKPDHKDFPEYLTTKWIWEVGELGATIRRADREALKAFITTQAATYRPPYGRYPLHNKPALASFIGTINPEGGFLNDPTGHRRFWPVNITSIDWAYTNDVDINEVWAQAYALYRQGESWQLTNEERKAHAAICELYEVEDPYLSKLLTLFEIDAQQTEWFMTSEEIVKTMFPTIQEDKLKSAQMLLGQAINKLGLEPHIRRKPYGRGYRGIRALFE